jgi:type IV pilus assembly protein PilY1
MSEIRARIATVMSIHDNPLPLASRRRARLQAGFLGVLLASMTGAAADQTVSQAPLSVAGNVPGNLLLVPSVEWPTLDSMANLGSYDVNRVYVGYFDAGKCYGYSYSIQELDRHFYPVRMTTTRTCDDQQQEWSGNYLNWAATQTIDPFRKALTGGYRVRDTVTETWLEKARYDGNGSNSIYPNRRVPASGSNLTLVRSATPAAWNDLTVRIWKLGNRMRFTRSGDLNASNPTIYDPAVHETLDESTVYEVSVRVEVCDSSVGVEANCKQYSQGWKPEGLIQKYAERIRYSVFGYLNDSSMLRDGGVLRAKQKFVGATRVDASGSIVTNPNAEWDPTTGVLIRNPDVAEASATASRVGQAISDGGVINYINKFGQMTLQNHKSHDPVSELYYTAVRYLKNQGNVPEYTSLEGTSAQRYDLADGFPVITAWDDPIQHWCQSNAILGIGDVNTHRDKNLPGNTVTTDEPTQPAQVTSDTTINVVTATRKVAQLEGISVATPFTGRENSAYIAGLAYDAHTKDLRPDLDEKQTASTYWVDVRENQVLEGRARNQYWLAAKYGGFAVPDDFDPEAHSAALDLPSWSSGELLSTGELRPENFYVASEANKMVESLTRAFARIAAESVGSGSSLAANSTRLETDTRTFQAQFFSGTWRGELKAFSVSDDGTFSSTPLWRAGAALAATSWSARKIYVHNPQGSDKHVLFTWSNLGSAQRAALGSQDIVDYLRGDRGKEESQTNGSLRTRTGVLGDIVSSTPVYVGSPNPRLYAGATFTGASSYGSFVNARATRAPMVYVGANDGMLHGFDANTGAEVYAFVPNAVILNGVKSYSDPDYQHRYFVDGEMAVADVYDTSASRWKTVVVGTLGRGGPGVFALDVTDPANVKFLWEKSGADIAALGKNIGRPVIAQVADGDWRVLIGNGVASSDGSAQLIMIRIANGAVDVVNSGATGSNGLTAVLARDSNGDGFADTAYAGDLRGNLWKFADIVGSASVLELFEARDRNDNRQPITAAPLVGKDPRTGALWVFFGTGRYLGQADSSDTQVQTWYGIKDTGTSISGRSELAERSILVEGEIAGLAVRVVEEGIVGDLVNKRGWYMDLASPNHGAEGERMVVPNRFQGRALIGTTRIPGSSDVCRPSGRGFVMAIDPFTGARLDSTFFDVSRDGLFSDEDMLLVDGRRVPVTGVGFASGPNNPLFVDDLMQVSLDDGTTETIKTQGSSVQASRMSWRELLNGT